VPRAPASFPDSAVFPLARPPDSRAVTLLTYSEATGLFFQAISNSVVE